MTFPASRQPQLNGNETDIFWMQQALMLAKQAALEGEVPVGAIVVFENEILGQAYNQPIAHSDPTAHAEIIALRQAAEKIGNYRLLNTSLYVTLEPCLMCAGAIVHARVKHLIYGADDKKAGAIVSKAQVFEQTFLNHKVQYKGGVLKEECSHVLSQFFAERRL